MLEMFNDRYAIYNCDCYDLMSNMPDNSVDFQIYSPPFATLYIYSDDLRDLGNCQNYEQFFEQYDPIIKESLRILRTGRLAAVHCKQIAKYKNSSGAAGWYDFRGEIIRHYEQSGFQYHSEVVIWTDPRYLKCSGRKLKDCCIAICAGTPLCLELERQNICACLESGTRKKLTWKYPSNTIVMKRNVKSKTATRETF